MYITISVVIYMANIDEKKNKNDLLQIEMYALHGEVSLVTSAWTWASLFVVYLKAAFNSSFK